jgi:hypothetical protein
MKWHPAIKDGNGKCPMNGGFHWKIIYKNGYFPLPCLTAGEYCKPNIGTLI